MHYKRKQWGPKSSSLDATNSEDQSGALGLGERIQNALTGMKGLCVRRCLISQPDIHERLGASQKCVIWSA